MRAFTTLRLLASAAVALFMTTCDAEVILIPPAYAACVVTICGISGATGPGAPPICAAALLLCACFDESNELSTRNGTVSIANVQPGVEVLTMDPVSGASMWTKVLKNNRMEGDFVFTTVTIQDQSERHTLAVTENHMFIKLHEGTYSIVFAASVQVGDMVRHAGGAGRVEKVGSFVAPRKFDLMTDSCSVLANNVLTTTSCEDVDRQNEMLKHDATGDLPSLLNQVHNMTFVRGAPSTEQLKSFNTSGSLALVDKNKDLEFAREVFRKNLQDLSELEAKMFYA